MARKDIIFIFVFTVLCSYGTQDTSSEEKVIDGMVLIPAGEFEMGRQDGASDEHPVHTVYIDAFYMDIYEVSNRQYKVFVDANPKWQKDRIERRLHDGSYLRLWNGNDYPPGKGDHPVNYISWYAAMAYAEWVGKRLPTEAEWEKAARGGLVGKAYPWGETIDATHANYARYIDDTSPIGQYAPNGYGLYDMVGNVWEWCLDKYDSDFYMESPKIYPFSGDTLTDVMNNYININTPRVFRGGCWTDNGIFVRVDNRDSGSPMYASVFGGFRCVKTVPHK